MPWFDKLTMSGKQKDPALTLSRQGRGDLFTLSLKQLNRVHVYGQAPGG